MRGSAELEGRLTVAVGTFVSIDAVLPWFVYVPMLYTGLALTERASVALFTATSEAVQHKTGQLGMEQEAKPPLI